MLFYQDFNEQFEGYTQQANYFIPRKSRLFYQDFNEQFEGYTQLYDWCENVATGCFIRISMNNLKDIHNDITEEEAAALVVLSGFQ